jgi:hypothetical protein
MKLYGTIPHSRLPLFVRVRTAGQAVVRAMSAFNIALVQIVVVRVLRPHSLRRNSSPRTLLNFLAECRHALGQNRSRVLARTAKFKGAKVFVPISLRSKRFRPDPLLQSLEIRERDLALLNAAKQVLPKSAGQLSEAYLRQSRPSRRWRAPDPCPPRSFGWDSVRP